MRGRLDPVGAQLRAVFIQDVSIIEALGISLVSPLLGKFYDQREAIEAKLIAEFENG